MKDIVFEIIETQLNKKVDSISKIVDLGMVNNVYDVISGDENYIVRLNPDRAKEYEFYKEKWCMEKASTLNIPSPQVLKIGVLHALPYMVMHKIEGLNGSKCSANEKISIWKNLGRFAKKFHAIKQIDELKIRTDEFHANWLSKLEYNIGQLSPNDSLIKRKVFNKDEHEASLGYLKKLKKVKFKQGLIHGDLCPRNTIINNEVVFLIDWGSSKIDIVPHSEIGIVQMDNELNQAEFDAFLLGLELNKQDFAKIEAEIAQINFLNRLDLYRWA